LLITKEEKMSSDIATHSPVYIPWKSLAGYLGGLKGTTLPHTLDNTVKPKSMSGGLWRQLTSALQFLDLIGPEKEVTDRLEALVDAYGQETWSAAVKEYILPAYERIVGDLPLENATQGQLGGRFRSAGGVEGQMLKKAVRFYIRALEEAKVKYSQHFSVPKAATNAIRKRTKKTKDAADTKRAAKNGEADGRFGHAHDSTVTPKGLLDLVIPLDTPGCLIRIPQNIEPKHIPLFDAVVNVVRQLAEQRNQG
jgi:hypothetical protein